MSRNEADTRADLIDPKLKQDGWGEVEGSYIRREVICPGRIMTGGKRGTQVSSDYVLVYQGRKLSCSRSQERKVSPTQRAFVRPRTTQRVLSVVSPMPPMVMTFTRSTCHWRAVFS